MNVTAETIGDVSVRRRVRRDPKFPTAARRSAPRSPEVRAFGTDRRVPRAHARRGVYSWWDYRGISFFKDQGLRIDHILATARWRRAAPRDN